MAIKNRVFDETFTKEYIIQKLIKDADLCEECIKKLEEWLKKND